MKILITGSSGFVGTHLVERLSKLHKIVKYDLIEEKDILNEAVMFKSLKDVDLVIHLAAFISANESWKRPKEYLNNNALGTLSVIRNSIKAKVKKVIFFSSAAVKATPLTPYAVSKIAAEEIVKLYSKDINIVIIRPENIYGMGQKSSYGYVIHNFINAVKSGAQIKIYGDGKQERDFVYIDDVVATVEKLLLQNKKSGSIISLGTGTAIKVIDLAKKIMKISGKKSEIIFLGKRDEPRQSISSVVRKSFIDLDHGIKFLMESN